MIPKISSNKGQTGKPETTNLYDDIFSKKPSSITFKQNDSCSTVYTEFNSTCRSEFGFDKKTNTPDVGDNSIIINDPEVIKILENIKEDYGVNLFSDQTFMGTIENFIN